MQEAVVGAETKQPRAVHIEVAPAIASVIGSAARPNGVPAMIVPPEQIPGRVGLWHGLGTVLSSGYRGIAWVTEQRERHGDIYRGAFLDRPVVFVWDADEIQKILRNDGSAWSSGMGWDVAMFQGLDKRSGGNIGTLLSMDFDDHKTARALVQPAFTLKAVQGYLETARREIDKAVPRWVARGVVDFKREVRTLLSQVAGQIFTGIDDPKRMHAIDVALTEFWAGMMALSRKSWLSPTFRRSQRGFETLYDTFRALAPDRRTTGSDLFSLMVQGAGDEAKDDAVVRVFLTIMFGAFDTTSAAVTSMAYLLAKHPDWQERLRAEASSARDISDPAGLKSLKELEWVWKETLRLMPVSGFVPRRSLRDVQVGKYTLPAGTMVAAMQGGIGRHPRWWKDPDRFDPERFSPERAEDKQHPALAMTFGAGPHSCIGTQLAGFEMKLLFHRMLTSCQWTLAKDYDARHTFTPMGMVSGKVRLRTQPLSRTN